MDKIFIEGLQVQSLIGVYDWERTDKTPLIVDVVMSVDLQKAAESDDVEDTIDYAKVAEVIEKIATQSEFELLEALASSMIQEVLDTFPCQHIQLKLSKPEILDNARNVAIQLSRSR